MALHVSLLTCIKYNFINLTKMKEFFWNINNDLEDKNKIEFLLNNALIQALF